MNRRTYSRLSRFSAALAVLVLLSAAGPALAGPRVCAIAAVPEPFVLPDGAEYPAGSLRLCRLQRHYPSSTLLVGYVDGQNVGLLLGTAGHDEAEPGEGSFLQFARRPDGRLWLDGYGLREAGGVATYSLRRPDRPGRVFVLPMSPAAPLQTGS